MTSKKLEEGSRSERVRESWLTDMVHGLLRGRWWLHGRGVVF